jgi:AcrR family transcriptional regulator
MGRSTAAGEPSSNKREAVLDAAIRCFAAHGLAGTGMRDIARAAGLTEGTLYHYFATKNSLIEDAFRWSAFQPTDVRAAMRREQPLRQRLLDVGAEFLAALRRNPHWTRVVIREALRAAPDSERNPIRGALVALARERIQALGAVLQAEASAGRVVRCDPRRVAEHLFHALIGHFVAGAIAGADPPPRTETDAFLVHLVDTIVGSLEPSAGRRALGGRRKGRAR